MKNKAQALVLVERASAYLGMIAEVRSKCVFFKNQLDEAELAGDWTEEQFKQTRRSVRQMARDLAKYTRKLKNICEELQEYGVISNMD